MNGTDTTSDSRRVGDCILFGVVLLLGALGCVAQTPQPTPTGPAPSPSRPHLDPFPAEQDWSFLADQGERTDSWDRLKYVRWGPNQQYISLGLETRTEYEYFDNWIDSSQSAPIGKAAAGDFGRFNSPAAQSALAEFAGSDSAAVQQKALDSLQQIVSTQAPVIPLLYGAAWYEYSTKDYTGWPTESNQYNNPVPNDPYILATVLHLKPVS